MPREEEDDARDARLADMDDDLRRGIQLCKVLRGNNRGSWRRMDWRKLKTPAQKERIKIANLRKLGKRCVLQNRDFRQQLIGRRREIDERAERERELERIRAAVAVDLQNLGSPVVTYRRTSPDVQRLLRRFHDLERLRQAQPIFQERSPVLIQQEPPPLMITDGRGMDFGSPVYFGNRMGTILEEDLDGSVRMIGPGPDLDVVTAINPNIYGPMVTPE
jgi:hypothetical protein